MCKCKRLFIVLQHVMIDAGRPKVLAQTVKCVYAWHSRSIQYWWCPASCMCAWAAPSCPQGFVAGMRTLLLPVVYRGMKQALAQVYVLPCCVEATVTRVCRRPKSQAGCCCSLRLACNLILHRWDACSRLDVHKLSCWLPTLSSSSLSYALACSFRRSSCKCKQVRTPRSTCL